MKKLFKKLRSRRGVTLTEILITVLIASMTAAVVAAGVSASMRVYKESTAYSDAQTLVSILSQAVMDELRFATDVSQIGDVVTFTSHTYGSGAMIATDENGYIAVNKNLLLPKSVYGSFKAKTEITFSGGCFTVGLSILENGGSVAASADFSVCPLEN